MFWSDVIVAVAGVQDASYQISVEFQRLRIPEIQEFMKCSVFV